MLNGAAIPWRSKQQPTLALSSAEAEFFSASALVQVLQEVIYLRKFLANLGYPQTKPTQVFTNNETCIAWSESPQPHDGTLTLSKRPCVSQRFRMYLLIIMVRALLRAIPLCLGAVMKCSLVEATPVW